MGQRSSALAARDPTAAAKPPAERVVRDIRRRTQVPVWELELRWDRP